MHEECVCIKEEDIIEEENDDVKNVDNETKDILMTINSDCEESNNLIYAISSLIDSSLKD